MKFTCPSFSRAFTGRKRAARFLYPCNQIDVRVPYNGLHSIFAYYPLCLNDLLATKHRRVSMQERISADDYLFPRERVAYRITTAAAPGTSWYRLQPPAARYHGTPYEYCPASQ
jgi:hypothetical protein